MTKSLIVASLIIIIPLAVGTLVHLLLLFNIISPFVAGFVGIYQGNLNEKQVVKFIILLSLIVLIPALIILILFLLSEVFMGFTFANPLGLRLAMIVGFVMIPGVWFLSSLGAVAAIYVRRRKTAKI